MEREKEGSGDWEGAVDASTSGSTSEAVGETGRDGEGARTPRARARGTPVSDQVIVPKRKKAAKGTRISPRRRS